MIRARRVWQSSAGAERDRRESRAEDFSPEEESEPDLHGWLKEEPQDDWRRRGKEEPDLSPEEEEEKPDLSPEEAERPDLSPEEEESPHSRTRSERGAEVGPIPVLRSCLQMPAVVMHLQ